MCGASTSEIPARRRGILRRLHRRPLTLVLGCYACALHAAVFLLIWHLSQTTAGHHVLTQADESPFGKGHAVQQVVGPSLASSDDGGLGWQQVVGPSLLLSGTSPFAHARNGQGGQQVVGPSTAPSEGQEGQIRRQVVGPASAERSARGGESADAEQPVDRVDVTG